MNPTTELRARICYHGDHCTDGLAAMVIMREWLVARHYDVDLQACNYNELPIPYGYDYVCFVDFCPTGEQLEIALNQNEHVAVIDHHPRAVDMDWKALVKDYPKTLDFYVSAEGCGAMLVWGYCYPKEESPQVLKLIDDRDRWQWRQHGTKEWSAAFQLYSIEDKQATLWELMFGPTHTRGPTMERMLQEGAVINLYQQQVIDKQCRMAHVQVLSGYPVVCVNTPELPSETCHTLLDLHPYTRWAACWHIAPDGTVKYSVRSRNEVDTVHTIVIPHGGGGHHCAGGMTLPKPQRSYSLDMWDNL
jgi:hypothetical protein